MSSGGNKLLQNTREKVLSTDINRRQALAANDLAQIHRFMVNLKPTLGRENGGELDQNDIPSNIVAAHPLYAADIYNGLMVVPISGTLSVHIVEGVIGIYDPDGETGSSDPAAPSPDDNAYKIVRSAGIQANGILEFEANASGATRIDMIECQRVTQIVEQDNRDIFNPATGQFVPTLVDKLEDGELTFRIRKGTPGLGLPATEDGWIPLAVAKVPNAFTDTDDIVFWDVRPMIQDRKFTPFRGGQGLVDPHTQQWAHGDITSTPGFTLLTGHLEGADFSGNIAGGRMRRGDTAHLELSPDVAGTVREPGFAPGNYQIIYLWAIFPLGLPRWVRYQDTPSGTRRVPLGPKGIMVLSEKPPLAGQVSNAVPSAAISAPAATELLTSTVYGVCLAAITTDGAATPTHFTMDGQWTYLGYNGFIIGPATLNPAGLVYDEYVLVSGTHYPPTARAVRGQCQVTISVGVPGNDVVWRFKPSTADATGGATNNRVAAEVYSRARHAQYPAAGTLFVGEDWELPVINKTSGISVNNLIAYLGWSFSIAGGGTKGSELIAITGWKMGD